MKNRRIKSLILITASILLISSCGKQKEVEKIIRPVKVIEIKNSDSIEYFSFSGITTPSKETILSFKIAGPIESMNLTQGQTIKKDEILAKMDSRDYEINLEVYKKKYEAAKASADNAVLQYNRAEKLYKADAMTKKNFDIITAQKKAAVSLLKEAQQGVENARNKLKDTELKAPYSGYISKKFAEWEKKRQKEEAKFKEAQKLKNMTEQEKKDLEFKQLQEKIAKYEKQATLGEMSKVARSILADEEISVNDELLANLVSEDADTTKANVENFAKIFKAAVQKEVAAKLRHEPPKKGSKTKMTKEEIFKVENTAERQKLISENMELFQ